MAILKRSVFVVVGKEIVYWRLPGPIPTPIPCMSWCLPDLIKDCAKPRIHNYRGGLQPEDHAERLLWEDAWLQEAIRRFDTPNGRPPAPHAAAPAHVRVKRERFTFAKKLASVGERLHVVLSAFRDYDIIILQGTRLRKKSAPHNGVQYDDNCTPSRWEGHSYDRQFYLVSWGYSQGQFTNKACGITIAINCSFASPQAVVWRYDPSYKLAGRGSFAHSDWADSQ